MSGMRSRTDSLSGCRCVVPSAIPKVSSNDERQDIKRKFNTVLDLGCGPGHFSKLLDSETTQKVVMVDSSGRCSVNVTGAYSHRHVMTIQTSSSIEMRMMNLMVSVSCVPFGMS